MARTRGLLDSALMLQTHGHFAGSQAYLELALGEISQNPRKDSSFRPLTEEILGAMRNNLPYSLAAGSDPEMESDGRALLDSLAQLDPGSDGEDLDTSSQRKYRAEAMLDTSVLFDLPVEINDRVLAQLKVFKERVPAHFQRWLERKGRWEAEFTHKLAERGMPQDLIYLAMIESGFNSRATSPAAATGIWQFIPSTGRRYGLRVDRFVDERRDPWKATDAALDFLSSLYLRFGDWKLAMAAYNCGEGCVDRAIRKLGRADYWDLPIPAETRNYVPRVFAAAILGKRPELHGFQYTPWEPLSCDTFTVEGGITLLKVAEVVGAPAESLALLNPALIKGLTPPVQEPWLLRLPPGTRELFDSAYAFLEKSYQAPAPTRLAHRVRRGETLPRIASRYGVSVASIKSWNRLRGSRVKAGRTLTIYADDPVVVRMPTWQEPPLERRGNITARNGAPTPPTHKVRRGETLQRIAAQYDVSVTELMDWNNLSNGHVKVGRNLRVGAWEVDPTLASIPRTPIAARSSTESDAEQAADDTPERTAQTHKIRHGETLQRIARTYGVSVQDLMTWNNLASGRVKAGQNIKVFAAETHEAQNNPPVASRETTRNDSRTVTTKHRVRHGETLSTIALRYGISTRELMQANGLRGPHVRSGQALKIPGQEPAPVVASAPRERVAKVKVSSPPDRVSVESLEQAVRTIHYTVRPGDTLYSIARARSTTVDTLKAINGLSKADLRVGQIIKVPRDG